MAKQGRSSVDRGTYVNYYKRARECMDLALRAMEESKFDGAAINFVHCGISACDALCVYFLGQRHSGEKHEDAVKLLGEIKELRKENFETMSGRLVKVLRMKNMAEYEERPVKPKEAEALKINTEKLFACAEKYLI